ncbi:unnamed protein product [Soboliphyme baturini]|uniref:Dymeclin n=1 Tax=Soboliphyme baturini TaxID=241478 RepID=A0A183IEH9_9BILA|nr:unnamed protein product [Soboliphyme baturini]
MWSQMSSLTPPSQAVATFKLNYPALYEKLCASSCESMPLLLLYFLLHKNIGFRNFLLSRVDIENLVLPLLNILYDSCTETVDAFGCHHLYIALIIMLILSEDDFFCKIVHEISLKSVPWYSERPKDMSLGSLVILVLVKNVQHNMSRRRDRYLQTNCLAALANMSAYFKNLPPFVCQKFMGLLDVLSKRHARLLDHVQLSAEYDLSQAQEIQDVAALEEAMRMLLEIFNCTLTYSMAHSAHLIYAMLYEKSLFEGFQQHPMFQDLIWNIIMVKMDFSFSGVIVQEIQKGAIQWPSDRLKKFPELKFKYIEDKNTDEFFIPYIWSLIFKDGGFYFDPAKIKLFTS